MSPEAKDVKEQVDILDVLDKIGARFDLKDVKYKFDPNQEVPVFCPFCEDANSRKPAGRVNLVKQVYHCWNCGVGGDVISVAGVHLDEVTGDEVKFADILNWLADEFIR